MIFAAPAPSGALPLLSRQLIRTRARSERYPRRVPPASGRYPPASERYPCFRQSIQYIKNRYPGPLRLIPAALSISWSSKTRWATQTLPGEPLFTRSFDIFTEQPPGVCGRSIEVFYRANLRLFGTLGLMPAAEGIPRSRRGNTDAKGATRTRFNRTKPHVFTHHASYRRTTYRNVLEQLISLSLSLAVIYALDMLCYKIFSLTHLSIPTYMT